MSADRATTVLLVRHGQTSTTGSVLPGRAPGLHLAERGLVQAQRVADRLGDLARPPSALYSSPLERARETAAPIARRLALRTRVERGLIECDFGTWTGATRGRLRRTRAWRPVQHPPRPIPIPAGESI